MRVQIQSILTIPGYKTHYWMKQPDQKARRVSKVEWFKAYDSSAEVLPPLTKTNQAYEDSIDEIRKAIQRF